MNKKKIRKFRYYHVEYTIERMADKTLPYKYTATWEKWRGGIHREPIPTSLNNIVEQCFVFDEKESGLIDHVGTKKEVNKKQLIARKQISEYLRQY